MQDQIHQQILVLIAARSRACLLQCDGVGRVLDRLAHPGSAVSRDIREAESLDACLSRQVRDEWIDLIREAICAGRCIESLVVLDGIGLELSVLPTDASPTRRAAWLMLMPLGDAVTAGAHCHRRALRNHEWGRLDALSRCQLDTLRHVTNGQSNQQIADHMHRSKRAVEWHIRHLHRLLGAGTRECLARVGRAAGIDRFSDPEWADLLGTRPARRTLEEYALARPGGRAA
jgi:DNA-binding CsgD family transcriptional regulator